MLFTTSYFLIFGLVLLVLYWWGPKIIPRNFLLLVASWFFYSFGELRFFPILFLFTSLDFACAKLIRRAHEEDRPQDAFHLICFSVVANIGLLAFFKLSWLLTAKWPALNAFYIHRDAHALLPIGISFYTFQSLSYTIDVYRKRVPLCSRFSNFALYVSFFPQLIAGPIERATHLLPQLKMHYLERRPTRTMVHQAGWLIFWGVVKKVAIADRLMPYTRWGVSELGLTHGWDVWLSSTVFILEFLCDFSAYTDIALGMALLFGINLSENFRFPYFATSPSNFWRRWHVTLGTWFKDYVYVPLRKRRVPRAMSIMITMILVGVWHGAELKFLIWGIAWGLLMVGEDVMRKHLLPKDPGFLLGKFLSFNGWAFVMIAWIVLGFLFVSHSVPDSWELAKRALGFTVSGRFRGDLVSSIYFLFPFLCIETISWLQDDKYFWFRWPLAARVALVTILVLFLGANYAGGSNEFIYFAF